MNTSDRAKLFALGYAFRRRFGHVSTPSLFLDHQQPSYDSVEPPIQRIPNQDDLREMVFTAAHDDLRRMRPIVDIPQPGQEEHPVLYRRDAAVLDPVYGSNERIQAAFSRLQSPDVFDYRTDTDALDAFLELGYWLTDEGIVELGHSHAITVAKFLVAADFLMDGDLSREWLDYAVLSHVVPQLDSFLSDVEEEHIIGTTTDSERSKIELRNDLIERLRGYGLERSAAAIEAAEGSVL